MLPDAVEFVKTMKKAALEAVNASKPVEVCFGKVTSASPLKILVEQKMTLGAAQLVLSRNVTTYTTEITVGGAAKEKITVHNGLVVGDEVILLRQQGGQKYIVMDRIG